MFFRPGASNEECVLRNWSMGCFWPWSAWSFTNVSAVVPTTFYPQPTQLDVTHLHRIKILGTSGLPTSEVQICYSYRMLQMLSSHITVPSKVRLPVASPQRSRPAPHPSARHRHRHLPCSSFTIQNSGFGSFLKWFPQRDVFIMQNPIKIDDLGVPPWLRKPMETSIKTMITGLMVKIHLQSDGSSLQLSQASFLDGFPVFFVVTLAIWMM